MPTSVWSPDEDLERLCGANCSRWGIGNQGRQCEETAPLGRRRGSREAGVDQQQSTCGLLPDEESPDGRPSVPLTTGGLPWAWPASNPHPGGLCTHTALRPPCPPCRGQPGGGQRTERNQPTRPVGTGQWLARSAAGCRRPEASSQGVMQTR